ncbi:DNA repair protein RecN [Rickettsiales bacterium LUAb2]
MLKSLVLSNFIIIKQLELDFNKGLTIFTGETGAGKSIILDAISIVLGSKANKEVIREGEDKASILAVFVNIKDQEIINLLSNNEIAIAEELIIRRVINNNGSSKAFINDVQVSINFLKQVGDLLLEVHGQFDNQKLLNPVTHINLLDNFINKNLLEEVKNKYLNYKQAKDNYNSFTNNINKLKEEQNYLEFVFNELEEADIKTNEEADLINKRILLSQHDKISNNLLLSNKLLNEQGKILYNLNKVINTVENVRENFADNKNYIKLLDLLNQAFNDLTDCEAIINDFSNDLEYSELSIDEIEERLMLIRTLAKKHKVNSIELPSLLAELRIKVESLNNSFEQNNELVDNLKEARQQFIKAANDVNEARVTAAKELDRAINHELLELKLPNAKFFTEVINNTNNESLFNNLGNNKVVFKIKTNLEGDFKDLNKIASGGEMARFMLAIKVVLMAKNELSTIIFDEVDIGVGGEVAHSVGTRLQKLAEFMQVLVVTHSHQVAALGKNHYKVIKVLENNATLVKVANLTFEERVNELARMISADKVTNDAKVIATNLLKHNNL